jgi:hypothetical protein
MSDSDDESIDFAPALSRRLRRCLPKAIPPKAQAPVAQAAAAAAPRAILAAPTLAKAGPPGPPAAGRSVYGKPGDRSQAQHDAVCKAMRRQKAFNAIVRDMIEAPPEEDDGDSGQIGWRIDAAYASLQGITCNAVHQGVSRVSVRLAIKSVAKAWLDSQIHWLGMLGRELQALHGSRLEFFCDKIKWDETKMTFPFNISSSTVVDRSIGSWNVMVSRRYLTWKCQGQLARSVQVVMPPRVLLGSITADTFYDALFKGALMVQEVERCIAALRCIANVSIAVREGDFDSKNLRMQAWESGQCSSHGVLHSFHGCQVHQNNMCVEQLCKHIGRRYVDALTAYGKLLRMGNYWLRTVLSIERVLADRLIIIPVAPPATTDGKLDTLLEYLCPFRGRRYYRCSSDKQSAQKSLRRQKRLREDHQKRLSYFSKMWNGGELHGRPVHYCHASVCDCTSREESVRACAASLVMLHYRHKPVVPTMKDWLTVEQTSSWFAFVANLCGSSNIAADIFESSVRARASEAGARSGRAGSGNLDLVPAAQIGRGEPGESASKASFGGVHLADLDWHAMLGKRMSYVREHSMSFSHRLPITLIAIITGALEWVTKQMLLSRASLQVWSYIETNPALVVAQFFSAVLAGGVPRLELLFCGTQGCHTYQEVVDRDPKTADIIRTAFVDASVSNYVRSIYKFEQYPWKLAVVGCDFVPAEVQNNVVVELSNAKPCCLDVGFSQGLTRISKSIWGEVIQMWADQHDCSTFDIELIHARNQGHTHRQNTWDVIAGRHVNAEAKYMVKVAQLARASREHDTDDTQTQSDTRVAQAPDQHSQPSSRTRPHKSALQLFHKVCARRDKHLDINPCTKDYWKQVKSEWAALRDDDRRHYEAIATRMRPPNALFACLPSCFASLLAYLFLLACSLANICLR